MESSQFKNGQPDNRESFLRDKEMLFRDYQDKFVVYIGGGFAGWAETFDELCEKVKDEKPHLDVYVEKVNKEAFEEPPPVDMTGLHEVLEG